MTSMRQEFNFKKMTAIQPLCKQYGVAAFDEKGQLHFFDLKKKQESAFPKATSALSGKTALMVLPNDTVIYGSTVDARFSQSLPADYYYDPERNIHDNVTLWIGFGRPGFPVLLQTEKEADYVMAFPEWKNHETVRLITFFRGSLYPLCDITGKEIGSLAEVVEVPNKYLLVGENWGKLVLYRRQYDQLKKCDEFEADELFNNKIFSVRNFFIVQAANKLMLFSVSKNEKLEKRDEYTISKSAVAKTTVHRNFSENSSFYVELSEPKYRAVMHFSVDDKMQLVRKAVPIPKVVPFSELAALCDGDLFVSFVDGSYDVIPNPDRRVLRLSAEKKVEVELFGAVVWDASSTRRIQKGLPEFKVEKVGQDKFELQDQFELDIPDLLVEPELPRKQEPLPQPPLALVEVGKKRCVIL